MKSDNVVCLLFETKSTIPRLLPVRTIQLRYVTQLPTDISSNQLTKQIATVSTIKKGIQSKHH